VTTWDNYDVIQDGATTINDFMNIPGVKKALNAPEDVQWTGCIPGAGRRRRLESTLLIHDQPLSTLPYITELLEAGKRVLIYSGDRDLSTCAQGTELLLNSMNWTGASVWPGVKRGLWVVDEYPAGYAKSHLGLDFVVVYNSGHLVPFNQPRNALDLFTRFLVHRTFADYDLPAFDFGSKEPSSETSSPSRKHHHSEARYDGSTGCEIPYDGSTNGFSLIALLLIASLSFLSGLFVSTKLPSKAGYSAIPDSDEKELVVQ
jgi:hypothetical protein